MALDPWYAIFTFHELTKMLQAEAISEILTLTPGEKRAKLHSYGLTKPCRALVNDVLRGMNEPLENWSRAKNIVIKDLCRPNFRPEAFRLERGATLWPTSGDTVLLMPLTTVTSRIQLIPNGSPYAIPIDWEPGMLIHLSEMGIRYMGEGSVRFIYIMLQTGPRPTFHLRII